MIHLYLHKEKIARITSGLLLIFCAFYISSCLKISSATAIFSLGRETKFIFPGNCLVSPSLDVFLIILLNIVLFLSFNRRYKKYFLISIFLAFFSLISWFVLYSPTLFSSLLLISLILSIFPSFKELGVKYFLIGASIVIIVIEILAFTAIGNYFLVRSWSPATTLIIIKERAIWSSVEWLSIIFLVIIAWTCFVKIFLHKELNFEPLSKLRSLLYNNPLKLSSRLTLAIGIIVTIAFVLLPHFPSTNPSLRPVSVDTFFYKRFLTLASNQSLEYALNSGHAPSARPIYLVSLYYVWKWTNCDVILLLDVIHPIIALVFLVISVYYVSRKLFGKNVASISAIVTPISHAPATFIAGGFQANSIALPLALLIFTVEPFGSSLLVLFSLLLLVALIHPWTFAVFSVCFLIYRWRGKKDSVKRLFLIALIAVLAFILSNLINLMISPVSGNSSQAIMSTFLRGFSPNFSQNLFEALQRWTWTTELNPVLLITASCAYGTSLMAPFFTLLAPAIFTASSCILHRIILDIPLYIGSSVFLSKIDKRIAIALILAMAVRSLEALAGLKPYEIELWERTFV